LETCGAIFEAPFETNDPVSLTLLHAWSQTTTPGSATIATMLRQDTILEATGPDGCNCQLSLISTD
jgi:hypothetical protein